MVHAFLTRTSSSESALTAEETMGHSVVVDTLPDLEAPCKARQPETRQVCTARLSAAALLGAERQVPKKRRGVARGERSRVWGSTRLRQSVGPSPELLHAVTPLSSIFFARLSFLAYLRFVI
jgi:hypothetical protein